MKSARQIGAFFDLDGTLLQPPSLEWRFIGWLAAHDHLDGENLARWLSHLARTIWHDPHGATFGNKTYLAGLRESLVADWESSPTFASLALRAGGLERIAWHFGQGHRVFLVSGTLDPLARATAQRISKEIEVRATPLHCQNGRWTGQLAGEHMRGEAKARAVRKLALQHEIDLSKSYAYGNGMADLPMLEAVGRPVAVNPCVGLERIATGDVNSGGRKMPPFGWRVAFWKNSTLSFKTLSQQRLYPGELQ